MALTRTLLTNHWISASVALEALDRYVETRIPLGRLALAEGMLKVGPLLHILDEQLGEGSVGDCRRFGEIAVALGYLDEIHVKALLAAQAEVGPSFEQILTDLGAFESLSSRVPPGARASAAPRPALRAEPARAAPDPDGSAIRGPG
jgi:hypothetical protein